MALYTLLAALLYAGGIAAGEWLPVWMMYLTRILMLAIYLGVVARFENVPVISRLVRKIF